MTETKRARSASPKRQKDNPKKWMFTVDAGFHTDGRRRQITRKGFASKELAQAALDKVRTSAREGTFVASERLTVEEYLVDEWLPTIRRTVEASTWESYDRNLRCHVIPTLGSIRLQRLEPGHLDALYTQLLIDGRKDKKAGGLSARTVRYIHTILHRALHDAARKGRVTRNVGSLADPPSAKAAKAPAMRFWTPDELARFLESVSTDRLGPVFRVAAMTGMRRGEVLGLTWGCVDLDAGVVTIERQVRAVRHAYELVDVTKSASGRRSVDIDPATVAVLRGVRARQARERLALGAGYRDSGLVFTGPDGSMLNPEATSFTFDRRVAKVAVPAIRFHDLRHTHAVHLIAAGAHPKAVSERLGHASTSFTLDRYGHLMPNTQAGLAVSVAALVDGTAG
jgi:integrase